ncbi:uncharacterized protein si:cabz01007807.1 isoform X1 [Oncorhynchus kisutch]|uniref:uncharacterized protein si:cabz01007807.1 isoform X1 n=1 Tax=Oncorhynchus kisutch TaxID=8019 RepID=UPI0012DBE873|nr:uncharacterized protein LOC109896903 isoform X1 [Oncorhynchus kisutch]
MDKEEEREGAQSEPVEGFLGERRPSIMRLQGMLRRVSQSPFRKQYRTPIPSTSESRDSSDTRLKQNGINRSLSKENPFYSYMKESSSVTIDGDTKNQDSEVLRGQSLVTVFTPPPDVRSTPDGLQPDKQTGDNLQTTPSDQPTYIFKTMSERRSPDLFETTALTQNTPNVSHSPLFVTPAERLELWATPSNQQDLFKTQPSKTPNPFQAPPTKGEFLFNAPPTKGESLFNAPPTKGHDLFQAPLSIPKDPFQSTPSDTPNLIQATPIRSNDPFQIPSSNVTPDIFQPLPSRTWDIFHSSPSDIFQSASFSTDSTVKQSTPLFQTSPGQKTDVFSGSDFEKTAELFNASLSITQDFNLATPSDEQYDILLMTPHGTKHVLQPTSTAMKHGTLHARSLSATQAFNGTPQVKTSNSPPKPPPQKRQPKLPSRTEAERPDPKPGPQTKNTAQDNEVEVFENILLTGQEICVEDWPENSPELNPDWKPSGKLRLRRESMKVASDSDGGSIEELEENGAGKHAKTKRGRTFKVSFLSRRGSKDKYSEDLKDSDSGTLRRGSKERFSESKDGESNSLRWRSKGGFLDEDFPKKGVDVFSADYEDKENYMEHGKPKKSFKFKMPLVNRRGSKDRFSADHLEKASGLHLPQHRANVYIYIYFYICVFVNKKSNILVYKICVDIFLWCVFQEGLLEDDFPQKEVGFISAGENEDEEDSKQALGLDENSEEEPEERDGTGGFKKSKGVKIKFVPHRGFAICLEKDEPTGAHEYTPRRGSKMIHEKPLDELKGAHGYTPRKESKVNIFEETEEVKGYTPQSHPKQSFLDDYLPEKGAGFSSAGAVEEYQQNVMEDCKPKKPFKLKLLHMNRRKSGSAEENSQTSSTQQYSPQRRSEEGFLDSDVPQKGADLFYAGQIEDEQNEMEDWKPKKPSKFKNHLASRRKSSQIQEMFPYEKSQIGSERYTPRRASHEGFLDDDTSQRRSDLFSAGGHGDDYGQDDIEDCKPKKSFKFKAPHKHRKETKTKARDERMTEYPPGATSSDYYFSEAAEAEWRSAQIDEQLADGLEDEEEEEEGDTDSLMEWWNTVEQWDELPSDDEDKTVKDDETRSFTLLAEKVHRGLSVFNKVFTERAEVLWQYVIKLYALADDITSFHKKAKIGNITGGTTAAVGGGAAIVGLALAPFTFGASLIITAVGVGVAAAGGITSASATISDNVNNMQDRKKVEVVLEDYEARMEELVKILRFVCEGLYRLRGHPLLRRGTQHYSGDWEVRRAVQMVSLVDRPVLRATEVTEGAAVALRGLFKGMDKYFTKDSRELKKGFKKEVVFKIRQVAQVLHESLMELNAIREELQDANGNI